MKDEIVSVQIWANAAGIERVWGNGAPADPAFKPLLGGERHSYVRNEDRPWRKFEILN